MLIIETLYAIVTSSITTTATRNNNNTRKTTEQHIMYIQSQQYFSFEGPLWEKLTLSDFASGVCDFLCFLAK